MLISSMMSGTGAVRGVYKYNYLIETIYYEDNMILFHAVYVGTEDASNMLIPVVAMPASAIEVRLGTNRLFGEGAK